MNSEFRNIPSVDQILSDVRMSDLLDTFPHSVLLKNTRKQLDIVRESIVAGGNCPPVEEIIRAIEGSVKYLTRERLFPVINASGVIVHTNLGRAPLSDDTIQAMDRISHGYSNLEYDIARSKRGSRHTHIEELVCELTGAESALVVNNNAAGVLLALTALAKRKEVIVSRGQAVEIGGSFRIPDVMRQSGAKLIEVGTTNCTYGSDYQNAINERTVALMRVHSSNFKLVGFINEVSLEELCEVGTRYDLPVFDDLGSGCFLDTEVFGLEHEPTIQESIASGAGLTFFSGDKLVGGPQAGIIAGKKLYVDKIKKHPLARAIRIDKIRLAGIAATLIHYIKGEATEKIPVWRMISTPIEDIDKRARKWADALEVKAEIIDGETMVGGGSLPGGTLPTKLLALQGKSKTDVKTVQRYSALLRDLETPIIGRINDDTLLLDPRTVLPEDDARVIAGLKVLKGK